MHCNVLKFDWNTQKILLFEPSYLMFERYASDDIEKVSPPTVKYLIQKLLLNTAYI